MRLHTPCGVLHELPDPVIPPRESDPGEGREVIPPGGKTQPGEVYLGMERKENGLRGWEGWECPWNMHPVKGRVMGVSIMGA